MNQEKLIRVCMIVPDTKVKGGIATVVNGYRTFGLGKEFEISYIESYCDGSKLQKFLKALYGYVQFIKELFQSKPDIVHIHSSFGPSFWREIPFIYMAGWLKIPIVNHVHGAEFDSFYVCASNRKKRIIKNIYSRCTAFIALSEEWQVKLESIVPRDKITVIENYCIIPEKISFKKKQILFLGEIGERKGCFDIPAIYAEVLKKQKNVPLLICGDGESEKMNRLFREKHIEDAVSFLGWVRGEEKERLLMESAIFLFPSYNEGMPMALLEAMAYGLAVVTTNVGGIPKLIDNGIDGYICEPGDILGIAEKVTELMKNDEKRVGFGVSARKKMKIYYSYEIHAEKLRRLYRRLLRG